MKKYILSVMVMMACTFSLHAQMGMRAYGGLSAMSNQNEVLNPGGPTFGWHAGADIHTNGGAMYFILGGRFTDVVYTDNKGMYTSSSAPHIQFINTRIGLGFDLINISESFKIRAKALGSIDYVFNVPIKVADITTGYEQYRAINTVASLVGGVGVSLGTVTLDLEYGHGIFNLINKNKDSDPTFLSLSAGFYF